MHDDADPVDDWAPLRPEQLALRPGEVETPVAPAPQVARKVAPPRPLRQPTPEGERAFAELQQRLLAMPQSDSIVAEMQRREQREARRRDGRVRAGEQLAATVVAVEEVAEPAPAPELEFDEKHSELDPRELESWFQELPEAERERLRAAWAANRHRHDWTTEAAKKRLLRGAAYGGLCFFMLGVLMLVLTGALWQVPLFVLSGAISGALATLCGGERFTYAVFGALGFVAVQGHNLLRNPFTLYGLLFAIAAMAAIGMDREMRRSAGCRDD